MNWKGWDKKEMRKRYWLGCKLKDSTIGVNTDFAGMAIKWIYGDRN